MPAYLLLAHERGLLFRNGKPSRWLEPGKHRVLAWGDHLHLVRVDLNDPILESTPEARALLPQAAGVEVSVPPAHLGLVTIDGRPHRVLLPGRYLLLQLRARVEMAVVSTAPILADLPDAFLPLVPETHLVVAVVAPYERVLLYVNGALARVLAEGRYAIFHESREVRLTRVDLREREIQIVGQEVMTADKASIRVSLVVKHRVVDPTAAVQSVASLDDGLYSEAQLVARRYVAGLSLDQLLERRGEAATAMREALAPRAREFGVEIAALDVKDVVLPGEMKALLNRVIEAEKQAAASNIMRREETAATRSLANTAKLLEQSPTLMRLKELESFREIAGRVGQVTVVATPQQLLGAMSIKGG